MTAAIMTSVDAENVSTLLPQLRRYARALMGSQTRGDTYVRLCLELLLATPQRMSGSLAKLELFRAFHDGWRAINLHPAEGETARPGAAWRSDDDPAALPAIERQVLLLTHLEGFSLTDTASIVSLDVQRVRELLEEAKHSLELETRVAILIIEDEPLIAMDLAKIVTDMGHEVCGTAARQDQAIELAKATRPSLILADIQLRGDGSGIHAVREILKTIDVPIIFVTGYPERLLTGEDLEPAFVVTKPFNPDTLKVLISQALSALPPPERQSKDVA